MIPHRQRRSNGTFWGVLVMLMVGIAVLGLCCLTACSLTPRMDRLGDDATQNIGSVSIQSAAGAGAIVLVALVLLSLIVMVVGLMLIVRGLFAFQRHFVECSHRREMKRLKT
jgi:hypothetical protein